MDVRRRTLLMGALGTGIGAGLAAPAWAEEPGPLDLGRVGGLSSADVLAGDGDAPLHGRPSAPSRDVDAILRKQDSRISGGPRGDYSNQPSFYRTGYKPRTVPREHLPYTRTSPVSKTDTGVTDASGVRMYSLGGKLYNHPVAQAQWGLNNLESYLATKDSYYLNVAIKQAQRLVDTHIESRNAWYLPYPFDFYLHGYSTARMAAPWYSAMAQGQALSLFTRLFNETGRAAWRVAADGVAASFFNGPAQGLPWTVHLDGRGFLWLEEYARWPHETSDYTFNGHLFGIFGLYDYAMLTKSASIIQVFDGALTTAREYVFTKIRYPNWASHYCLAHPAVTDFKYHAIHQAQLLAATALTGEMFYAYAADALRDDYPTPEVKGTVSFSSGSHTGYKFDSRGNVTASRTVRFTRASTAPANQRIRIRGKGIHYRITAGAFAGYYVAESYPARRLLASHQVHEVYPERTAYFRPQTYCGYRYTTAGATAASKCAPFTKTSSAPFQRSGFLNGRPHVLITRGAFANYWVPAGNLDLQKQTVSHRLITTELPSPLALTR